MNLETQRLILRPWRTEDAPSLYRDASDARVGPCAGWPPHTSVENSRQIIETILSAPGTYAIVLKETNEPVGSAGLMIGEASRLTRSSQEAEIGYWIGVSTAYSSSSKVSVTLFWPSWHLDTGTHVYKKDK